MIPSYQAYIMFLIACTIQYVLSQPMSSRPKIENRSFCLTFCIRLLSHLEIFNLFELSYLTISVRLNLTFSELVIYLLSIP